MSLLRAIKTAAETKALDKIAFEVDTEMPDLSAEQLAALTGIGGLASVGAIGAKRSLENQVVSSLESTIRADQIADAISRNARAREVLDDKSLLSVWRNKFKMDNRLPRHMRKAKATISKPILALIKKLQLSKIL